MPDLTPLPPFDPTFGSRMVYEDSDWTFEIWEYEADGAIPHHFILWETDEEEEWGHFGALEQAKAYMLDAINDLSRGK